MILYWYLGRIPATPIRLPDLLLIHQPDKQQVVCVCERSIAKNEHTGHHSGTRTLQSNNIYI